MHELITHTIMRQWITAILVLCTLSLGLSAQNPSHTVHPQDSISSPILTSANLAADEAAFAKVRVRMDSIRQYRPTVGLVLAGGGARGLAHLGVIKYMEELGIPVDVVTGTSMGGLVGGLYALGRPAQDRGPVGTGIRRFPLCLLRL